MASTITQATFVQRVLRRLNESAASNAGDFTTGTGGSPTLTTTQAIVDYASEGVAILCRTCWPLRASFTLAVSTITPRVQYQDLTAGSDAPSGAVCWQALKDGIAWTPNAGSAARLVYCTEAMLSLRYRDYLLASAGTPTNWYPLGGDGIGLYPSAGNSGTLTVQGLSVAPSAAGSGVMFPQIPDDILTPYIEGYTCGMIALKNIDDAILAARAPEWIATFDAGRKMLYERMDPLLQAYFPDFAPTPVESGD